MQAIKTVEGTPDAGSTADIFARRGRVHTTPNSCSGVTGTARSVQGTTDPMKWGAITGKIAGEF